MKFVTALCGSVSLWAMASPALAQQADSPATPAQIDTVVVTGSRIVRNGYLAPTPVTVATVTELLATTPTNIADALNKLPEFSPQFTTQTNTGAAAPAGNYLNLRGLGQALTLVLLDGVRVPATNTTGTVDTNTLPQALVQRVEIVTGGASAIYGSDAVGGVVNYILDTKFSGFKGSVQSGISTYGDAPSNKISLVVGTKVFDNGHFEASYEHSQSAAINQADRSFTNSIPGYAGAGQFSATAPTTTGAANPYLIYNNLRMATTTLGGYIVGGPASLVGQQFIGSGTLAPFKAGAPTGSLPSTTAGITSGGLQVGGDGAYLTGGQLTKPLDTDNLFARFDYDVGHGITAYAQVAAGLSQTNYYIPPTPLSVTILSGNPYLPANAQAALTAASPPGKAAATLTLSSLPQNLTFMQRTNAWDSNLTGTFGLKGKLYNDEFSWNAAYTHGQGINHIETDNNINTSHFYAALDAVKDPSGNIVCNVSLTSSASLYPGCVPLNFIGQGNESAAALSYVMQNTAYTIANNIDDLSGSISGTAFNTWAGPVSVSVNTEARWVGLQETTDAPPTLLPQLTGLRPTWVATGRNVNGPTQQFVGNTTAAAAGANSVWEVGGEAVVPLMKDFTLVKNLEFSGALRYTQYSTSGPAITWKVGLNYQPINDLRIRATESRDILAPSLFQLFQGQTPSVVTGTDPFNNKPYAITQYSGGNPDVKPEVAITNTMGVVYSPSWFPRFQISADYYLISINGVISQSVPAIGAPGITATINGCDNGVAVYCQAIQRGADGSLLQVNNFPINLAEQYTRGLDVEASYGFDMSDIQAKWAGHTNLRLLGTYSPTNLTVAAPGQPPTTLANSLPLTSRFTASLDYSLGPVPRAWPLFRFRPSPCSTGPRSPSTLPWPPTTSASAIASRPITTTSRPSSTSPTCSTKRRRSLRRRCPPSSRAPQRRSAAASARWAATSPPACASPTKRPPGARLQE
jgi:iron complex outermembrane receptor protein